MNETETAQHGRRARRLSPDEAAAQETRTAAEITGEVDAVPGARGAVAPPTGQEPVPKLRKFGRRARIIELTEPEPTASSADTSAPADDADATPSAAEIPEADSADDVDPGSAGSVAGAPAGEASDQRSGPSVDRDRDGVELGELPVTDAPDPKPAPRFDGKVLHRPERSGGKPLVWVVWALIAIALIILVALLVAGVIGPETASAHGPLAALFESPQLTSPIDRPTLEDPAA